jgi:hypothetical protein
MHSKIHISIRRFLIGKVLYEFSFVWIMAFSKRMHQKLAIFFEILIDLSGWITVPSGQNAVEYFPDIMRDCHSKKASLKRTTKQVSIKGQDTLINF